ncbi:hypothetical protein [Martelella radicis]|uniref:Uncharacterized protein n=1 Tax=Martelella radicis TaxID=1397476 RepID=A0A7W6PD17_9HYPH|nr:hypothetical protein [Martelella radicis]MBB4123972.1 hypothetical protein [Martelella radicis]
MFDNLTEHSVSYIILKEWIPPLIAIVVGGLFASVLFPRWQENFSRNRARELRRLEILEEVSRCANRYIVSWKRLIIISKFELESGEPLEGDPLDRKKGFIEDRNKCRMDLSDALCIAEIYVSDHASDYIRKFRRWDDGISHKRLDELPDNDALDLEFGRMIHVLTTELRRRS